MLTAAIVAVAAFFGMSVKSFCDWDQSEIADDILTYTGSHEVGRCWQCKAKIRIEDDDTFLCTECGGRNRKEA